MWKNKRPKGQPVLMCKSTTLIPIRGARYYRYTGILRCFMHNIYIAIQRSFANILWYAAWNWLTSVVLWRRQASVNRIAQPASKITMADADLSAAPILVKNPKGKSAVWKLFLVKSKDKVIDYTCAVCSVCDMNYLCVFIVQQMGISIR